jgi:hypothetical protein
MEYKVVFSSEMDVNPKDFAEVWNNTPECGEIAKAEASKVQGTQFDMGMTAVILLSIGTGVASNAIYDLIKNLIKKKLGQKGVRKETEIMQIDQPDGTHIIAVKIKEG